MVVFPYQRLAYLFDRIKNEIIPQNELAKSLQVSTRTIRTDITLLNDILANYGANIEYLRGQGYHLIVSDKERFLSLQRMPQQIREIPRNSTERVRALLILFLTATQPLKLDDIADKWFISRSSLQSDMVLVRKHLQGYQLSLEKRPHYGLRVLGTEAAIRTCLTDLLWKSVTNDNETEVQARKKELFQSIDLDYIETVIRHSVRRFELKMTEEAIQSLTYNCGVSILRIVSGQEIISFSEDEQLTEVVQAVNEIAKGYSLFLGGELSIGEAQYLMAQVAARTISVEPNALSFAKQEASRELYHYILDYINENYNYNLSEDEVLKSDLIRHIQSMLVRVRYQICSPNPLLNDIKQYYPFAYDVTLAAVAMAEKKLPYAISEDEIGYLAVHVGVALERNYSRAYERHPTALLVSDSGNSTLRIVEAKIQREFPQLQLGRVLTWHDYEQLDTVPEDLVISTVRLTEKDKPIVKVSPFPTPYQLQLIGRLAMVDRTTPYILEHFFDKRFFMIVDKPMTREMIFKVACQKLEKEGYVGKDFYPSLVEREKILSTMLGENIVLPHSLGLLAKKTTVFTILAPNGIEWHSEKGEVANVIFLLAISKEEYEEAMAIYNLFVTFVKEKATRRLASSANFKDFQIIAKDTLRRVEGG